MTKPQAWLYHVASWDVLSWLSSGNRLHMPLMGGQSLWFTQQEKGLGALGEKSRGPKQFACPMAETERK